MSKFSNNVLGTMGLSIHDIGDRKIAHTIENLTDSAIQCV